MMRNGLETGLVNIMALAGIALFLAWESLQPFFPYFEGHNERRTRHFVRNVAIALLNVLGISLLFAPLWSQAASAEFGLLHRFPMPIWWHALLALLLLDGWTYVWHRANHEMAFFWRFHRMHHSDPWMDVTTARRFHPGEILFSSILRLPLIFLLGIHLWELLLYGSLMGFVVDFHHANIALPARADRWLRTLIVTPAMHKVHHSDIQAETNSNYTSLLSVWDRLFGTFRLRHDLAAIRIGLEDWNDPAHQTLKGLIRTPFYTQRKRT
jgi:sterol desaturase/sphingolipid hydroxylase (fatty acid hydroxylase superfamily)